MSDPARDATETGTPPVDDAALLADAFDVPPSALRPFSREPLGSGAVTGFEVAHEARGRAAPRTTIAYVDTSLLPVPAETGLVLEGVARVWTHPADPHLPALTPVAFGGALEALLRRLGIRSEGAPEIVGYRPGRRAVLRAAADGGRVWIKVVRPTRIERVVEAHRALREAGLPVPAVRGWSPEGVLVIDQAEGRPAPEVAWDPAALIAETERVRAQLAATVTSWQARTGVPERLPWYSDRALAGIPAQRDRIVRIREACVAGLARDLGPPRTVHGDLHMGQLFLTGTGEDIRISGLIDADTAGLGDADEDAAAFQSQAVASALLTEANGRAGADRVWALVEGTRERWRGPRVDALTAVHLIGHALPAAMAGDEPRAVRLLALAEAVTAGEPLRTAAKAAG